MRRFLAIFMRFLATLSSFSMCFGWFPAVLGHKDGLLESWRCAEEFMKYVEGAQRRREPANRKQSSTFYIIEVTQVARNGSKSLEIGCDIAF